MVTVNSTGCRSGQQTASPFREFKNMLDSADAPALLDRLDEYRHGVGRRGYSNKTLWRAYLASFILNLPSTNELIRRLQEDSSLREVCGFGDSLPHRTTFNRFINRLADHQDLIEDALFKLTDDLKAGLPGLGEVVAVDSTVVETYSNPNKKHVSDAQASWTAKPSEKNPNELEWYFGYKLHLMVDARHGVPITGFTTTASKNDTQFLSPLMDKAKGLHEWFRPNFVVADKGYDSVANHRKVMKRDALAIIPARKPSDGNVREGIYLEDGTPTCMGMVGMEYIKSDPKRGHLFRCRPQGCRLKYRKGVRYCKDLEWFEPSDNPRLLGPIHRGSKQWKGLYRLRQSVERVFKSAKQSLRLEGHYIRGLRKIALHALMSVLVFQVTALARLRLGQPELLRWMVRPVA